MVEPSCAVTIVVIVFAPNDNVILPEAEPLVTVVPLTVTVALGSFTVGVIVIEFVALPTDAV